MPFASRSNPMWSSSHADLWTLQHRLSDLELKLDQHIHQAEMRQHEEERRRADARHTSWLCALAAVSFLPAALVWISILVERL